MQETVLYVVAFVTFVTILFGSVCVVHLMYQKIYKKVKEELEDKYKKLAEEQVKESLAVIEAKEKGKNMLDHLISNNLTKEMDAEEFMAWRCFLAVRKDQGKIVEENHICCGKHKV